MGEPSYVGSGRLVLRCPLCLSGDVESRDPEPRAEEARFGCTKCGTRFSIVPAPAGGPAGDR